MQLLTKDGSLGKEIQTIIENTNDLMFVKNSEFRYIAASKAFAADCAGCSGTSEIIGKTDFEIFKDKTIAEQYRKDDEKLFESGKAMLEFREEYPDSNGKKHFCLTTKYLLFDKEGKPAAIFGQYHNIGEQMEAEFERRKDINKNIADALGRAFFVIHYIDLSDHSYTTLRSGAYAEDIVAGTQTIEDIFESFVNVIVGFEYQEKVREFCNINSVAERLKDKDIIACEYLSSIGHIWYRASFMPTQRDENGNVINVLFGISKVDPYKARDLDEGLINKKSLKAIFDEVPGGIVQYEWDGTNLKVLRMSKFYQDLFGGIIPDDNSDPDYRRVHPDDLSELKKAAEQALNQTHELEYVFRIWNIEKKALLLGKDRCSLKASDGRHGFGICDFHGYYQAERGRT